VTAQRAFEKYGELAALLDGREFGHLTDRELLRALDLLGEAKRLSDATGVFATAEVQARAVVRDGDSLSRALGSKTALDVVAERVGLPSSEARTWCALAEAISPRVTLLGEVLPPPFPAVAAAVRSGRLGVVPAQIIVFTVREVTPFLSSDEAHDLESLLAAQAPDLSSRDFARLCRRVPERLFPEGVELREDLQRARRGVKIGRTADGMVRWVITMHPEAAGFMTAAMDARTAPRRQPRFEESGSTPDIPERDDRTLSQRQLDALVDMARESLAHDDGEMAGTAVTMMVTVSLAELRSGIGAAEIAGVDETISAATARRLAASAEIIPCVLGGPSEILDHGRAFRLHTTPQRRAIAVRDGGCVWPGCNAPPSWCEVAHLRSWLDGGGTDLANGVLLCPFHHRRLDHDGWRFEWNDGALWLIPPAHLDASRTPRRAGRPALVG